MEDDMNVQDDSKVSGMEERHDGRGIKLSSREAGSTQKKRAT